MCEILIIIMIIWVCIALGNALTQLVSGESLFDEIKDVYFLIDKIDDVLPFFESNIYLRMIYPIIKIFQLCFFILLFLLFPIWFPILSYVRFVFKKK